MIVSFIKNFPALLVANFKRSCQIRSLSVSPMALGMAREIVILPGTSVDATSVVGSYTYIGAHTNITKTRIGRYCSIANNVSIGQGEHPLDHISTSAQFYADPWGTLTIGECEIGSDVWIGVDAVILRGVSIGMGAVIAANAVVTKDVAPFAIVGGVPARVLRFRFPAEKQQRILASRWWEKEKQEAASAIRQLEAAELELA